MKRLLAALLLVASPALAQANGWGEIQNGWGEIQTATGGSSTPATCLTAGQIPFLGSPTSLGMGCDAGLTYDAATDTLSVGRALVSDGGAGAWAVGWAAYPNDGIGHYPGVAGYWTLYSLGQPLCSIGPRSIQMHFDTIFSWGGDAAITRVDAHQLQVGTNVSYDGSMLMTSDEFRSANEASWVQGQLSELTTIADAAYTDTTINLPARSVIKAVVGLVVTVIPTAATFAVGDPTTPARFATGIGTAAGTKFEGLVHVDQTGAAGPRQTTTAKVRYTPNATPAAATGQVRTTVFYEQFTGPGT